MLKSKYTEWGEEAASQQTFTLRLICSPNCGLFAIQPPFQILAVGTFHTPVGATGFEKTSDRSTQIRLHSQKCSRIFGRIVQMLLRRIALKSWLRPVTWSCLSYGGNSSHYKFGNEHQLGHIHGTSLVERIDFGVYMILFLCVGQDDESASSIFGRENVHQMNDFSCDDGHPQLHSSVCQLSSSPTWILTWFPFSSYSMMPENVRGLQRRPLGIVRFQMAESTWS